MNFLLVGIGGFFGAIARYSVGLAAAKYIAQGFPYATLIVNVTGSFCMGLVIALATQGILTERLVLLIGIGFLGGFTTFSTFSADVLYLFSERRYGLCALNIIINPFFAISAAAIGTRLH